MLLQKLRASLTLGLLILVLGVTAGSVPQGREVALLFENDADWEHFKNRSSALLFYGKETKRGAIAICEEYNETLFDVQNFDDVSSQVLYQQYLEKLGKDDQLWVSSPAGACSLAPSCSSNATCTENADDAATLPFLCTNSAPHTSEVDTDFSASPKIDVASNGTVFTGTRDHLTFRFTGVPYAQPPIGPLRFQYPQAWNGTEVDATALKPGCLQFGTFENNDLGLNPWGISEDCLYLNVFTPYIPSNTSNSTSLKPVLLWIHGGANLNGLGSDATFDGGPFVSRTDTVVVTINYRLNIFGFLSLNDGVITGNYALADKIASLQWVKDNIAAFGGDPENVTIFGQSAGGWSIVDLLKSPPAKGLFSRAISQSGGASTFVTAEAAAAAAGPAVAQVCNSTGVERLECLQSLPSETVLNLSNSVGSWPSVQDGVYIIDSAVNQISQGPEAVNSVPFLLGFMPDEGQSLLGTNISPNDTDFKASLTVALGADLAERILESGLWNVTDDFTPYNATVNAYGINLLTCAAEQMIAAAVNSSAFPSMYVYTMRRAYGLSFFNPYELCTFPVGQTDPSYYLCHSGDLYEVFGTYHLFKQPVRVPDDIRHTALVQDLWGAFAKAGNPNPDVRYLEARGRAYQSTLRVLTEEGWTWPNYNAGGGVASLNYPALSIDDALPDEKDGRCPFLLAISS